MALRFEQFVSCGFPEFGFELYYLHADQAQKTFNQSLDWFRDGP